MASHPKPAPDGLIGLRQNQLDWLRRSGVSIPTMIWPSAIRLREHCALAERTAQLYMQIARKGANSATVADLGLQAAAQALHLQYGFYQPLHDGDETVRREWWLFALFLHRECGFTGESATLHIDWLGRKDFQSPVEWLGPEGRKFVGTYKRIDNEAWDQFAASFSKFVAANESIATADIEAELQLHAGDCAPKKRRLRQSPKKVAEAA